MIKCTICENHQHDGAKHTCTKCEKKIVYGEIQEPFIEGCSYYKMIEAEKKRQAYYKKINSLPIDDSGRGGNMKRQKKMEIAFESFWKNNNKLNNILNGVNHGIMDKISIGEFAQLCFKEGFNADKFGGIE